MASSQQPTTTSPSSVPVPAGSTARSIGAIDPVELVRLGTVARTMVADLRDVALDDAGRARVAEVHRRLVAMISESVSPELGDELRQLVQPLDGQQPSESEIRVAQAQLTGWLEGLFRGLQVLAMSQPAGLGPQPEAAAVLADRGANPGPGYL